MKILSIAFLVLFLFGCEKLRYGTIKEMWYEPESEYMMPMMIPMSDGKTTYYMTIYYWVTDNEDWCIKVNGTGTKGHEITRTLYVDPAAYDTLNVGDFICVKGMCDDDKNNTKVEK